MHSADCGVNSNDLDNTTTKISAGPGVDGAGWSAKTDDGGDLTPGTRRVYVLYGAVYAPCDCSRGEIRDTARQTQGATTLTILLCVEAAL